MSFFRGEAPPPTNRSVGYPPGFYCPLYYKFFFTCYRYHISRHLIPFPISPRLTSVVFFHASLLFSLGLDWFSAIETFLAWATCCSISDCLMILLRILLSIFKYSLLDVIYQKQKIVFDHISKHREETELKIRRAANFFWRTLRCLKMCSNTVLSAWYVFSVETKWVKMDK